MILDGQQRLTSLYNALYSKNPVHTKTDTGKEIDRYYYLNIEKALDPGAEDEEIVISVPADRRITSDFGRKVELDLSTREQEFKLKYFPLNIILNPSETQHWQFGYLKYHKNDNGIWEQSTALLNEIITPTQQYQMPVILLEKSTPKELFARF